MKFLKNIPAVAFFCLYPFLPAHAGTLSLVEQGRWVNVQYVYDGDTFRSKAGEKIRLLGINTPEVTHNAEPGQPFGAKAKARLNQLIAGKTVRLRFDRDKKDKYGRTLAQVFLRNGNWINRQLVQEGLAHVYTFAPNFRWVEPLMKAETEARQKKIAIWSHKRFRVLNARQISAQYIGQFRVVLGKIKNIGRWQFQMNKLRISIPRKYRRWFKRPPQLRMAQDVMVHGTIRASSKGRLFLALHSPYDLEFLTP